MFYLLNNCVFSRYPNWEGRRRVRGDQNPVANTTWRLQFGAEHKRLGGVSAFKRHYSTKRISS